MRDKIIIYLIGIIILSSMVAATITVNPTYASIQYTIGNSQPSKTLTFTNDRNVSEVVTISKAGNFINLSTTSITIAANSTMDYTVPLYIPQSTSTGLYADYLNYQYNNSGLISIPFMTTITAGSTQIGDCKLTPLITNYISTIKTGTSPFTKSFSITVSSACTQSVDIKTPIISGVTETSDGSKPISLTGSLSLGSKDPGSEAKFDVQFDVSGLQSGTYNPTITIPAIYKGEKIQTIIEFQIVVTGSLGPISGQLVAPTYSIPDQVGVGQIFTIQATNVDPNLEPQIFPNMALIGTKVEMKDTTWTWTGTINKTGKYEVSIVSMYNGGPIGGVYSKNVTVTESDATVLTGNMTFEFYPAVTDLQDGQNVSILIRDGSKIVDNAIFYINGIRTTQQTFIVEGGKKYMLAATHPNYPTIDYTLELSNKELSIMLNPADVETGETATVGAIDT